MQLCKNSWIQETAIVVYSLFIFSHCSQVFICRPDRYEKSVRLLRRISGGHAGCHILSHACPKISCSGVSQGCNTYLYLIILQLWVCVWEETVGCLFSSLKVYMKWKLSLSYLKELLIYSFSISLFVLEILRFVCYVNNTLNIRHIV